MAFDAETDQRFATSLTPDRAAHLYADMKAHGAEGDEAALIGAAIYLTGYTTLRYAFMGAYHHDSRPAGPVYAVIRQYEAALKVAA